MSEYDNSTDTFTVPTKGFYQLNGVVLQLEIGKAYTLDDLDELIKEAKEAEKQE